VQTSNFYCDQRRGLGLELKILNSIDSSTFRDNEPVRSINPNDIEQLCYDIKSFDSKVHGVESDCGDADPEDFLVVRLKSAHIHKKRNSYLHDVVIFKTVRISIVSQVVIHQSLLFEKNLFSPRQT
jgi:hypothetical protein